MEKRRFAKFAVAAKTALMHPKNAEISQWIGSGPSIKARARLAILVSFMLAAPTLFLGVKRSEDVSKYARTLVAYDQFWERTSVAQLATEKARGALWRVEAEPEIENERALRASVEELQVAASELISARPLDFESARMSQLETLTLRVADAVDLGLKHAEAAESALRTRALSSANLAFVSLSSDVARLEREVAQEVYERRGAAISAMSQVGRDQLILFLILLFAIPIFVGFVPSWLVAPLVRLRQIEHRIEEGRIRELAVSGRDEISQLARAIKDALMWREELDVRKSTKIFEIRNVLRAVIAHVNEPVFIIDRAGRINYANQPASDLLRVETHYLEGSGLADHFFSAELSKAVAEALSGDIEEEGIKARLEFKDGRVVSIHARLSAVHDRAGGVSRVVIVLVPEIQDV